MHWLLALAVVIRQGFPSEGVEGTFRNPMPQVQLFLSQRHPGSYRVYNLCSERSYDPVNFNGRGTELRGVDGCIAVSVTAVALNVFVCV